MKLAMKPPVARVIPADVIFYANTNSRCPAVAKDDNFDVGTPAFLVA
jgi:hypothetical protein